MTDHAPAYDQAPLLNPRFMWKCAGIIGMLAVLTLGIHMVGRFVGETITLAGHTEDTTIREIVIGQDVLALPANVIRFETQRTDGAQGAVDLYFAWPQMEGYSKALASVFNQNVSAANLIFVRASQATMSRDMSGRFEPIYKRIIEGTPMSAPGGLSAWRLKPGAGYAGELLYTGEDGRDEPYVVRCLVNTRPSDAEFSTYTGCQRDIMMGEDLSITYRFSIDLLPHWREIEQAIRQRFEIALATSAGG